MFPKAFPITFPPKIPGQFGDNIIVPADPYGPNLVTDGDMELAGVANWPNYGTPISVAKSSAQAHSGTQSLHVVTNANNEGSRQDSVSVENGKTYHITGWVYVVSSIAYIRTTIGVGTTISNTISTLGVWIEFTPFDVLSDFTGQETIQLVPNNGEAYFDDIAIREVL